MNLFKTKHQNKINKNNKNKYKMKKCKKKIIFRYK